MIDLEKVMKREVGAETLKFMQAHGGNHVALYKGWAQFPRMHDSRDLVEQQLAVVLKLKEDYGLAKRLIGRLRRIDQERENEALNLIFGAVEDRTVAPLADDLGVLG